MLSYCPNCETIKNVEAEKLAHHSFLPLSWGRAVYWLNCPTCNFEWCGAMPFSEEDVVKCFVQDYF